QAPADRQGQAHEERGETGPVGGCFDLGVVVHDNGVADGLRGLLAGLLVRVGDLVDAFAQFRGQGSGAVGQLAGAVGALVGAVGQFADAGHELLGAGQRLLFAGGKVVSSGVDLGGSVGEPVDAVGQGGGGVGELAAAVGHHAGPLGEGADLADLGLHLVVDVVGRGVQFVPIVHEALDGGLVHAELPQRLRHLS